MAIFCERNSLFKTNPDTIFTANEVRLHGKRTDESGYNLQIGTENQFLVDFALFPNPTDTLTMVQFKISFIKRYGHFPSEEIADFGYGSEKIYHFMRKNGLLSITFPQGAKAAICYRPVQIGKITEKDYYVCSIGQHTMVFDIQKQKEDEKMKNEG